MKLINQIQALNFPAALPETLLVVEQRFDAPRVANLGAAVRDALATGGMLARVQPGATVAVGVGSRGVSHLPAIVRAAIHRLRAAGAQPFVFPAMGSHGGATVEGQRELLAELGVTEARVGAEIRATMEVRQIGQLPDGPALYQDVVSAGADHTLLINRVKPHTDFHGALESGLAKMSVIGLGKQRGAIAIHAYGGAGFQRFLAPAARVYETHSNLIGGLAILENAQQDTAEIVGLTAAEIGTAKEIELLARARSLMATLPFAEIDVLVIQRIGKNISGTGMDTNVINRLMIPRQPEKGGAPDIAIIAVLDLTEETRGNAAGIGLANVVSARVAEKADWVSTYTNAITSGIFGMMRTGLPITMADDRRALQVALRGCAQPQESARFVFIRDTLALDRLWVSPSLRAAVKAHPRLTVVGEAPLAFAADGAMTSPWRM